MQRASQNSGKTESDLLDEFRRANGIEDSPMHDKLPQYRALAFTGDGIRRATFAVGVHEAIGGPIARG
jgi:hypothetical protein